MGTLPSSPSSSFRLSAQIIRVTANTIQGDEWKESVATPQAHSSVAFRVGPGAKNQPLHRGIAPLIHFYLEEARLFEAP